MFHLELSTCLELEQKICLQCGVCQRIMKAEPVASVLTGIPEEIVPVFLLLRMGICPCCHTALWQPQLIEAEAVVQVAARWMKLHPRSSLMSFVRGEYGLTAPIVGEVCERNGIAVTICPTRAVGLPFHLIEG